VIEPALAVGDRLAQVWVAGDTLRARWLVNGTWGAAEDVWADAGGISQPALAVGTDGEMWVAWIGAGPTGADDVFVSERGSSAESRVYLPLSLR
jgi:hypothetical protein